MSESLRYGEFYFEKNGNLVDTLGTPDDFDIGFFIEVGLKIPKNVKKTKNFPVCFQKSGCPQDKFSDYMNERKLSSYTQSKKLICDWTD